jgi:chromosome partitioning protein
MIIAVLNNKGGVGKTTTAVHVAYALAKLGKKVLCVDIDQQANLLLHIFPPSDVYDLKDRQNGKALPIMQHTSGVDVLPLSFWKSPELFAKTIRHHAKEYDFTLIDCPPSLESRTLAALDAATTVLIPTEPENLSYKGLIQLITLCEERKLPVLGIAVTRYDKAKAAHNFYLQEISSQFSRHFIKAIVPSSALFPSASGMNQFANEWAGKKQNPALTAYGKIAEYIVAKAEKGVQSGKV